MKSLTKPGMLVLAALLMSIASYAQKIGHVNRLEVLQSMTEFETAKAALEQYGADLKKSAEELYVDYQKKLTEYEENQAGWDPATREYKETELRTMQEGIRKFEANAQTQAGQKESELLEPILKKLEDIIGTVAKENSFAYVFDSSQGFMLYAQESTDITELVKKKLAQQ